MDLRRFAGIALLPAFAAIFAPGAHAASFDCAKAASRVERAICADGEVSQLDEYLGRYYAAARTALGHATSCLRDDQRAWLGRRDRCADARCLREVYLDRLAELDPLQPGATALRNVPLPPRPGLAWIVPPAADKVAAPSNAKALPGETRGVILDEVSGGDGFVVRAANGERHLLAMPMFLEPATTERLASFAREKATFIVRGHIARDGQRRFFEPSRCTFVYRAAGEPGGRVFSDPAAQPAGFKPHELAFATPSDGVARAESRSTSFYAVILKTLPRCTATEAERLEAQALVPRNKVFATRFECDGEEHLTYTNVDPRWGFLAAYGGATAAEAAEVLRKVQGAGRYPGANVRRMQAVLVHP